MQTIPNTWCLIESIYHQLCQLPESQHKSFLRDLDISQELTQQLLEMMSVSGKKHTLFESVEPHSDYFQQRLYEPEALLGTQQGDYFLIELIGSGGMASVYKAKQVTPIKRIVALKVLHSGAPGIVLERFINEQSLLAKLNHPSIAPIYTVGEIDGCIPFIAMEYIEGETLARYCNANKCSVQTRLSLFKQVCAAIGFCHQNDILHRDIKPENVLIKEVDGEPIPIVIDFGISADSQESPFKDGLLMGTPEYMCPHSFHKDCLPDFRMDVYSLGMLLLGLLAGKPDFNRQEFEAGNSANKQNQLLSWKPESLREFIRSSTPKHRQTMAESFGTTEKLWVKSITSDVDWIYKKATFIDPNERYNSVAELITDIKCLFENKPLTTLPDSFFYSAKKFIARHKSNFLGIAVLTLIASVFLLITLQQKHIVENQTWFNQEGYIPIRKAKQASDKINATKNVNMVETESGIQPEFEADIRLDVTELLWLRGDFQELSEIARQIVTTSPATNIQARIKAHIVLSKAHKSKGQYLMALRAAETAFALAQATDIEPELFAAGLFHLGSAYYDAGDLRRANKLFYQSWTLFAEVLGSTHSETLNAGTLFGLSLYSLSDLMEGGLVIRQSYEHAKALFHPTDLQPVADAIHLFRNGSHPYGPAETLHLKTSAFDTAVKLTGTEHSAYLAAQINLASALFNAQQPEKALRLLVALEKVIKVLFGTENEHYLFVKIKIGQSLLALENFDEAEKQLLAALTLVESHGYESSYLVSFLSWHLASINLQDNRLTQVVEHGERALAGFFVMGPDMNDHVAQASLLLAIAEFKQNKIQASQDRIQRLLIDFRNTSTLSKWIAEAIVAVRLYIKFSVNGERVDKYAFLNAIEHLNTWPQSNSLVREIKSWEFQVII